MDGDWKGRSDCGGGQPLLGAPTRSRGRRKLQSVSHTEIHRHAGHNAHRYTERQSTMHIDTDTKTQTSTQGTTDIHTQTRAQILRACTQFCCCAFACARCERPNILNFCDFVSTLVLKSLAPQSTVKMYFQFCNYSIALA